MSWDHTGNVLNSITQEEHDGDYNAKRVVSAATIYAVVNTGAAGVGQSIVTVANPVAISSAPTIYAVVNTSAAALSNVTLDPGSKTGIVGNVTLSDSKTFIGLTTTVVSSLPSITGKVMIVDPTGAEMDLFKEADNFAVGSDHGIMVLTVDSGTPRKYYPLRSMASVSDGSPNDLNRLAVVNSNKVFNGTTWDRLRGDVTGGAYVQAKGNITISDSKGFIGLVTVVQSSAARTITGNLTISDSKGYIGLVTAYSLNAGTSKTLLPIPVTLGNNSLSTVAVPTNAAVIKVTAMILTSNITTSIAIKSGVTYMTGNASIAVTLFPGSGFVMNGSPDSPSWLGCPSGALVFEKRDLGGTISSVGGHVIYYQE